MNDFRSFKPVALQLQTMALNLIPYKGARSVYLAPNIQVVPDYKAMPFLVIAFKSSQPREQTGEESEVTHYWEFGQYHNIRSVEMAGVGIGGSPGFFDCFQELENLYNRSTIGGLVDFAWFEYHGGYEPVKMLGSQNTEQTMFRAVSRLRCEGFNEG